jgi:hypothetical protein
MLIYTTMIIYLLFYFIYYCIILKIENIDARHDIP